MRRSNRELNVFSLSALDLFASAMGAFIIIAVILFPYYLKNQDAMTLLVAARNRASAAEAAAAQAKEEARQAKSEADKLRKQLEDAIQFVFLGIATRARDYVVLIDMSGSMKKHTAIVNKTLLRLLEPLSDKNRIQIIGYRGEDNSPQLEYWQTPKMIAVMDAVNKPSAERFIGGLTQRFDGGTPTGPALRAAIEHPVQAIILFSDGAPNGNAATIVQDITRVNAGQKEIHTVAIGDYNADPALVMFLQELSRKNNGGFVGVSN